MDVPALFKAPVSQGTCPDWEANKNVSAFANGKKLFLKVMKCIHKFVNLKNANYLLFSVKIEELGWGKYDCGYKSCKLQQYILKEIELKIVLISR